MNYLLKPPMGQGAKFISLGLGGLQPEMESEPEIKHPSHGFLYSLEYPTSFHFSCLVHQPSLWIAIWLPWISRHPWCEPCEWRVLTTHTWTPVYGGLSQSGEPPLSRHLKENHKDTNHLKRLIPLRKHPHERGSIFIHRLQGADYRWPLWSSLPKPRLRWGGSSRALG